MTEMDKPLIAKMTEMDNSPVKIFSKKRILL